MTKTISILSQQLLLIACFAGAGAAQGVGGGGAPGPSGGDPEVPRLQLEYYFMPDNVVPEANRDMSFCFVNHGADGALVQDATEQDRIQLSIPMGPADSDLEDGGGMILCDSPPAGWDCEIEVRPLEDLVVATFFPAEESVALAEDETVCFQLQALLVNALEGATFSRVAQEIHPRRAHAPRNRVLGVFKSRQAEVDHGDLIGVRPDQHHPRYTDGEAVAAVGPHFSGDHGDLSGIAPDQHHPRYTDGEAVAAVGPHFSGDHGDLSGIAPDQHHPRYTDGEAVAAVGPHFSGDHGDLSGIAPDQHHPRYTNLEAVAAMGPSAEGNSLNHARYTGDEAFQAVLDRDGDGSGLDADTLDGLHAAEIIDAASSGAAEYVFVGFASGPSVNGDDGLFEMNRRCKVTYGPEARFANSKEVFEAGLEPADLGGGTYWVHPISAAFFKADSGVGEWYDAWSAAAAGMNPRALGSSDDHRLSCKNWSRGDGVSQGLVIDSFGFRGTACSSGRGITCSAPR